MIWDIIIQYSLTALLNPVCFLCKKYVRVVLSRKIVRIANFKLQKQKLSRRCEFRKAYIQAYISVVSTEDVDKEDNEATNKIKSIIKDFPVKHS